MSLTKNIARFWADFVRHYIVAPDPWGERTAFDVPRPLRLLKPDTTRMLPDCDNIARPMSCEPTIDIDAVIRQEGL